MDPEQFETFMKVVKESFNNITINPASPVLGTGSGNVGTCRIGSLSRSFPKANRKSGHGRESGDRSTSRYRSRNSGIDLDKLGIAGLCTRCGRNNHHAPKC
ncbi:unnamed protein product [Bemisia tabaci]|uniref:Uncharacterized protein n=1 Tax=Bemisia tabaci TaxID=7038 RepID=A0A9P0A0C2_BEMTA|nr:unnamed protein product [Bemisia tabaci]